MNARQQYEHWRLHGNKELRGELETLTAEEIQERFGRSLEFGTGGLRGILGAGTSRMNCCTVAKATQGFAAFIKERGKDAVERGVAIAYDNRRQSEEFARITAGVLAANGIKAYLFESLRPTPELSFAVRALPCFGGVMITASHNPPQYNGYKLYDETGCQMVPEDTSQVARYMEAVPDPLQIACLTLEQAGGLIEFIGDELDEIYEKKVRGILFEPDLEKNIRVVFSPQHGTGNIPVRRVLQNLGYDVVPVAEQCAPDPAFSNTENPNPETEEAFALPLKRAEEVQGDLVLVTDPDCDRVGAAVRHNGGYIRLTGNQMGALLLQYILQRRKEKGTLPSDGLIFNTIVTSSLGEEIAASYGIKTEKTLTGFKYIGEKIHIHETMGDASFLFGYEESYGYLIGDFVRDKDGVQASVMICEMAAYYHGRNKTLYDVLLALYQQYGYYLDYLGTAEFPEWNGAAKIQNIMEALRENPPEEMGDIPVSRAEDYLAWEGFPKADVLRYCLADGSWAAVRPSGTEPKCKYYYCVRGKTQRDCEQKFAMLRHSLEGRILV